MNPLLLRVARRLTHLLIGNRRWMLRHLTRIAAGVHDADVLELGSGRQDLGTDAYSAARLFAEGNRVRKSDVDASYGHEVVDVTTMTIDRDYDVILCCNVLEHVWDHAAAVANLHRALRPGGLAVIVVPMFFPLHDEPRDYWRFTEHALRRLLTDFTSVRIHHRGLRQAPFSYVVEARR